MKEQVINLGKDFTMYVTDKGLVHRLYETHVQIHNKKCFLEMRAKYTFCWKREPQAHKYYEKIINCINTMGI